MRRFLAIFLILSFVLTLCACTEKSITREEYTAVYRAPSNGIQKFPMEFELEWDIKRSDDPEISNMPVYRFDTYEEWLHLKEIVGDADGGLTTSEREPNYYDYDKEVEYCEYNEWFFDNYTLLIGCIQVNSEHDPRYCFDYCQNLHKYYTIKNGTLLVYIDTTPDHCSCYRVPETIQTGWLYIAVPKEDMAQCNGIAFVYDEISNLN